MALKRTRRGAANGEPAAKRAKPEEKSTESPAESPADKSWEKELREQLQCLICHEVFTAPIRLRCGHLVCFGCWVNYFKNAVVLPARLHSENAAVVMTVKMDCPLHCASFRPSSFWWWEACTLFHSPDQMTIMCLNKLGKEAMHPARCPGCQGDDNWAKYDDMYDHFKICPAFSHVFCPHCRAVVDLTLPGPGRFARDSFIHAFQAHIKQACTKVHCRGCTHVGTLQLIRKCEKIHGHLRDLLKHSRALQTTFRSIPESERSPYKFSQDELQTLEDFIRSLKVAGRLRVPPPPPLPVIPELEALQRLLDDAEPIPGGWHRIDLGPVNQLLPGERPRMAEGEGDPSEDEDEDTTETDE